MSDFRIKLSLAVGSSQERERESKKKEKREGRKRNLKKLTIEGKKWCLDWNPNVTPEEEFRSALFCPKPLIFILYERLQEWGESYMLWELQENYTIFISHKTLAKVVHEVENAVVQNTTTLDIILTTQGWTSIVISLQISLGSLILLNRPRK